MQVSLAEYLTSSISQFSNRKLAIVVKFSTFWTEAQSRFLPPTAPFVIPKLAPTWSIAWGRLPDQSDTAIWQDDRFAIFLPAADGFTTPPYCFSSTERFVLIGDVWLGNRPQLLQQNNLAATNWQGNDLQLIADLWERSGVNCLPELIGMFALVVWDRAEQVLWLGRDRVGARTLYYTSSGATRWIASHLSTLAPHRTNDLDLIALRDYLCCAFVPGERTLWQQIRELRPGTTLRLPKDVIEPYWQLQEHITAAEQSLTWHSDRLRHLLNEVIQEYLPINAPVGVFLSGGLDSSCITALAKQFHPQPVHTFSLHFGPECPNELEFSSLVAAHCQTEHHILPISFREMWEKLPETMAYLDDPIGDPLTVPNLLLGRLAREFVQVTLNGEGGDPCFGGPKNQPMLMNQLYRPVVPQNLVQAYLIAFQKCATDLPQLLKSEIWSAVQSAPSVFAEEFHSNAHYLNRLMALNIKFKGADQILTKVNNLTQATGLQGRSPLFDPRLVDLSMQIPPEYKLSGVEEKAVLKQAVANLLPDQILNRPKSGMMVPVQLGFRQHWQKSTRALLLNRNAAIAPYCDRQLIRDWLDYRGDLWVRYGVKLWLLVSLETWLQVHSQ